SASSLKKLKRALAENLSMVEKLPPPLGSNSIGKYLQEKSNNLTIDKSALFSEKKDLHRLRLRIWNEAEVLSSKLRSDCLVLPWSTYNNISEKVLQSKKLSFWLPPILNSKQFNEVYNSLKKLRQGHFLCFGWEAFKLAKLLPDLHFELDWCFNISNLNALAYVRKQGLDAVLSKEWKEEDIPDNLSAYRASAAWNPLVSYTRFYGAVHVDQIITNSHKDNFFVVQLGNGVTAMFLQDNPAMLPKINAPLQLDIAISPKENPIQAAERLNRIIERFK
ncbi:MAG: hypothetical protein II567_05370, partial [Candidatus Riflebacteria bacterium]|nr:hypothetical protein [Candidatus Riflebacteria bacterium]